MFYTSFNIYIATNFDLDRTIYITNKTTGREIFWHGALLLWLRFHS